MSLGQGSIASTDSMQNCLEGSHQIDGDHLYWNILNRCDWVGRYPGSGTYTPIVDAIVDTQSRDVRQIEHSFCFDSEALVLLSGMSPEPKDDKFMACALAAQQISWSRATIRISRKLDWETQVVSAGELLNLITLEF